METEREPAELRLTVPTYNYLAYPDEVSRGDLEEFGEPYVPVLIRKEEGVRIVLGSYSANRSENAELVVERQPNGWMIFLLPEAGDDPTGYVYFLDSGKSYLMRDDVSTIRVLKPRDERPYRMNLKPIAPKCSPIIIYESQNRESTHVDDGPAILGGEGGGVDGQ